MKLFFSYFKEEFLRIVHHSDLRSMVFAAPLLYAVILSFAYFHGRVQEVPVGVVIEDSSNFTRSFLRQLDATEEVQIYSSYLSLPEAHQAMQEGKTFATLLIPRDFSIKQKHLRQSPLYLSSNASNFALANPTMVGTSTVAQVYGAGTLMNVLRKAGLPKAKAQVLANPIALEKRPIFNPLVNYSHFFVPGLIYAILQQIILVGLCFSVTDQKDSKTWLPPRTHLLSYVLGRVGPYVLVNTLFALAFVYILLPMISIASLWSQFFLVTVLSVLFTLAAGLMAFLFGLLFKNSVSAFIALMFYSMPAFLISGMSWPQYSLTPGLKVMSWLTPITHFGDAVRRTILEPQVGVRHVLGSLISLIVFSAAVYLLIYVVMKLQQKKASA